MTLIRNESARMPEPACDIAHPAEDPTAMKKRLLLAAPLAALLVAPLACADQLPFFQVAAHGGHRAGGSLEDSASGDSVDLNDGTSLALADRKSVV